MRNKKLKYSLTFTNDEKIETVEKFQAITKRNGFKQNALIFQYMEYVIDKLEIHEENKKNSISLVTNLDVFFDKNRVELGLSSE